MVHQPQLPVWSAIDSQLDIGKLLTSTTVPSIINDNPSYRGEIEIPIRQYHIVFR